MRDSIRILIALLLLALVGCATNGNRTNDVSGAAEETDTAQTGIRIDEQGGRPSAERDRFLPDSVESIYIASVFNESERANVEGRLRDELRERISEISYLSLSRTPRSADAVLRGRIRTNVATVVTRNAAGQDDRISEYIEMDVMLTDTTTDTDYSNVFEHYVYYNLVTFPVATANEIDENIITNFAQFITEFVSFGQQETKYIYGETNSRREDGDDGTIFSIPIGDTNEDGTASFEDRGEQRTRFEY